jgi:HlyD family secretion protein
MSARSGKSAAAILLTVVTVVVAVSVLTVRGMRDRPLMVSTTRAVRQDLSSWIATNGKVEPMEPHVIEAQITTFIEKLAVKEGQTVERGQVLMTLDAQDVRVDLAHMKEQLVSAEDERRTALAGGSPDELVQLNSDLDKTNSEIERLRREGDTLGRLYSKQAATRLELESNKTALQTAEADKRLIEEKRNAVLQRSKIQSERAALRIDEAQNAIRSLEAKLQSAQVIAPVSGTIYALPARSGTYVHTGDVLAELADLKRIRVRAFVDEPELGSLTEGQLVEITWDALPDRSWTGYVQKLPTVIVARGARNVGEVLCSVTNDQSELLPNTNVNVRIRTDGRRNVLTISRAAVHTDGNSHYVLVVEDSQLRKREIEVGASNATDYEILKGIAENDVIALPGSSELREGMAVSVQESR